MKTTSLAFAFAAIIAGAPSAASATTVTLDAVKSNVYLNNQTYTGSFDGTSVLPSSYAVNSISFLFSFTDNNDALTTGATVNTGTSGPNYSKTSSTYSGWTGRTTNVYDGKVTIDNAVTISGKQEGASVSLGGVAMGSGATSASQSTKTTTVTDPRSLANTTYNDGYYGKCFIICWDWVPAETNNFFDTTTTNTSTTTQDWSGSFTVAGTTTNELLIKQLLSSDILQFALNVTGDLYLTGAQVKLDITPKAVPEPSTALLMLAALGGLGCATRLRRKSK